MFVHPFPILRPFYTPISHIHPNFDIQTTHSLTIVQHLKPVLRSLHSLPSSPNPTPGSSSGDADPLHITLPIPPTTGEDRLNAAKRAEELGPRALHQLREARGAQLKRLRAMELTGKVGPDNMRRAKTRMEGVSERAGGEAKKVVEEVRKRLERG